jgi:signal transduction histidine kinase
MSKWPTSRATWWLTLFVPGEHVGPRGLRRLLDATVSISSDLQLEAVLRRVVEAAVDLVDARYGALGVLDESRDQLSEFITVGVDDAGRQLIGAPPKGLGLLGTIIRDARPLRLVDLHEHPDSVGFPPGHPPMTSFLGVPIRVRDTVFGNLYLTDKRSGEVFTDVDEELALGLASAAAVAIENARLFEQVRRREATMAAMQEVASTLLAGAGVAESLQLVASRARELLRADLATVALPQSGGESLLIEVVDGVLGDQLDRGPFPVAGTVSGEVLRTGAMVVVDDASKDHRLRQPQVGTGQIGPGVWVALAAGGHTFGTLSVARSVGRAPFSSLDLEVAASFATQASVVLEHNRARRDQQRLAMLEDQERIARDLHDTVIQRLFATGMSLQGTVRAVTDQWARERITAAVDDLDVTIRQVRTVIFGLEETRTDSAPALRAQVLEVVREAARVLGFDPQVTFEGPLDTLVGEPVIGHLVATLREALSNVARHAAAHLVRVDLRVAGGEVRMTVEDDGRGIDPAAARRGGRGLGNMRDRAVRHGGSLHIAARPEGGTVLTWRLPLPP